MASMARYGKGAISLHGKGSLLSSFALGGLKQQAARLSTEFLASYFVFGAATRVEPTGREKNAKLVVLQNNRRGSR